MNMMIRFLRFLAAAVVVMMMVQCTDDIKKGSNGDKPPIDPDPNPGEVDYKLAVATPRTWDGEKRADITYQLLVYSFADSNGDKMGDFNGITAKLDYLQSLGVSAIWLSPIHPADSYHGYDVTDYTKVNPQYGTEADFNALVAAAHAKGIRIYLDYVLNHTGKGHAWFKSACASETSPYRNYYIFSQDPAADIAAGKIPMITDGVYVSGEWKNAPGTSTEPSKIYKFRLDWSNASAPKLTVTTATVPDAANPDQSPTGAKYLYSGDPATNRKFYDRGNNIYELTVNYQSPWGFLIRTSATEWDAYKYGARNTTDRVQLGVPFTLTNSNAQDIKFEGMKSWQFHSNFYTDWMPDLNYGALASFRESKPYQEVVNAAKGWIDRGVDGLRLDAVKHIYHNSYSNENPTFLKGFYDDLNTYFKQSHTKDIYMVGEVLDGADRVAPYYSGLPALFEFDFMYRLSYALNNGIGRYFVKDILSYQQLYAAKRANYIEATKLSNHDEERTRSQLENNVNRSKLAAAVLLTAGGSPYIYYGEELGFYGKKDKDDQYVRSRMLWGDSYTTNYTNGSNIDAQMESSVGTVTSQSGDNASLLKVYRTFTALRNNYPALAVGTMTRHAVYNEANDKYPSLAAWYRQAGNEKVLVLHNFGPQTVEFTLDDNVKEVVATLNEIYTGKKESKTALKMSAYSTVVFTL